MSYLLRYGGFTLPSTFHPADDPTSRVLAPTKLPRADGARILTGYLDAKRLVVRGGMVHGPITPDATAFLTRLDTLKAALAVGKANLYFGRSDRYYRDAQVESIGNPYIDTGFGRLATDMDIVFVSPDPFEYAETASTDTWTVSGSGQTDVVTTAGNAYVQPVLSITVGGSGAKTIAYVITNNTTGESFTLAGDVTGGDVIVVDCLLKTVKIGGVDKTLLFDGQFFRLNVGANTLAETYGTATITQVVTDWRDRWR